MRQFIVPMKEAGQRIDKWLVQKMPGVSRNKIKSLLDQGRVLINQRRILIAGWELEPNDRVEVRLETETASTKEKSDEPKIKRFLNIIHEDKDILVVDKPAGVLAEPKKDSPHEDILSMVHDYLRRKYKAGKASYVALVHRLDRETSGVMVVAKSKLGMELEEAFRSHRVKRHYTAVVEGAMEKGGGKIDFPLEKGEFGGGRKVRIAEGPQERQGRRAVTLYEVLERYPQATLLRIMVGTGRTHQIRVHLAKIGHPLIGDAIYGRSKIRFPRHALHASFLSFVHPETKKKVEFESKLPKDILNFLDRLRGE